MKELRNINSTRKIKIVYFVVKIVIIKYDLMQLKTFLDIEIFKKEQELLQKKPLLYIVKTSVYKRGLYKIKC